MPATSAATLHPKLLQLFISLLLTFLPFLAFVCPIKFLKMAKRSVAANSSFESTSLASLDQKLAMAKRCSHGNVYFESVKAFYMVQNYGH